MDMQAVIILTALATLLVVVGAFRAWRKAQAVEPKAWATIAREALHQMEQEALQAEQEAAALTARAAAIKTERAELLRANGAPAA